MCEHKYTTDFQIFKGDFLNVLIILHPQIPDIPTVVYPNKPCITGTLIYSAFMHASMSWPLEYFVVLIF